MSDSVAIGSATLTSSWATIGSATQLTGSWGQNSSNATLTLRIKHTKGTSQSGGYPMVRVRWQYTDSSGTVVTCLDPLSDGNITVSTGVATLNLDTPEMPILALTDADGTLQYPIVLGVPAYAEKILVQAKQAGDTSHLGVLVAELSGHI